MKIFSSRQIKEIDQYTISNEPIPPIDLMERAATAFCDAFVKYISADRPVFVFAGPGNNGGDALAVARILRARNYSVDVFLINPKGNISSDCAENKKRLLESGDAGFTEVVDSFSPPELNKNSVVVDGIFGTGLNRSLAGGFASLVKMINKSKAFVISIDIPSGMYTEDNSHNSKDTIIQADRTFTFQFPKLAFLLPDNERYVGNWEILDIRLHPAMIRDMPTSYYCLEKGNIEPLLKTRSKFAHKNDFGHALLIAGSLGKMGAAVLSSEACLRSGAGLLTVHVPSQGNIIMQTAVPEAMTDLDSHDKHFTVIPELKSYKAIGIGPGLGCDELSAGAFYDLLERVKVPLILDADALNLLDSPEKIDLIPQQSILTPHIGEFNRLAGISPLSSSYQRLQAALGFAAQTRTYLVLKGAHTAICTPDGNCYFNTTGNPGMATAGSGDVLTGIILALVSQGYSLSNAACLGVYLHGLAGDIAADKFSQESMLARDIIRCLPDAFREIKS